MYKIPLMLALLLGCAEIIHAQELAILSEGVPIREGKWAFTTTTISAMEPEPKVQVAEKCMTGEPYNPAARLGGDCKVENQLLQGNRLTWEVVCTTQLGPANGMGEFTATDTNANGFLNMIMHFSEQEIVVNTTWKGNYLGECDS